MALKSNINVAFCIDRGALIGLHISLATLLLNLNPKHSIAIFLVHNGLSASDLRVIAQTIAKSGKSAKLETISFSRDTLSHFDKFVGGFMTYARLFLTETLTVDRVIYLDADLIFGADVSELWAIDTQDKCIGAVSWEARAVANDSQMFKRLGQDLDKPYFNAGVLLMNLNLLRERNHFVKLTNAAAELKGKLISCDQSLLNLCLFEEITHIPRRFNTTVSPRRNKIPNEKAKNRVLHLIARPKPWDLLGRIHGQYAHYVSYRSLTALPKSEQSARFSLRSIFKLIRSFRAYVKCFYSRISLSAAK